MKKLLVSTLFIAQLSALQYANADEILISKDGITLTDKEVKAAFTDLPPNTINAMKENPNMMKSFMEGIFENKLMAKEVSKKLEMNDNFKIVKELNENKFLNDYYIKQQLRKKLEEIKSVMSTLVENEFAVNKDKYAKPDSRDYYHIYFSKDNNMSEESPKEKAEKVLSEIKSNKTTVAEAAEKYHIPMAGGGNDGMLKNVDDKTLTEEIRKVTSSMKIGEVSDVVETPDGYHIVSLAKINPSTPAVLDSKLKDDISAKLRDEIIKALIKEERLAYQSSEGVKFDSEKLDMIIKDLTGAEIKADKSTAK